MILTLSLSLICLVFWIRERFYRAYFFQKQRNRGVDPCRILRQEFPWIWWLL